MLAQTTRIISAAGVMRAFVTRDAAPDIPAAREEDVIWARRIVADLLAREARKAAGGPAS
jgi:hypothetical protein